MAVLIAVATAATSGESATAAKVWCKVPKGAHKVAENRYGVIIERPVSYIRWVCNKSNGFSPIFTDLHEGSAFALTGRYVAVPDVSSCGRGQGFCIGSVTVARLGGRARAISYTLPGFPQTQGAWLPGLVLRPNGSFAWISNSADGRFLLVGKNEGGVVSVLDRWTRDDGYGHKVDSESDAIDPDSLALSRDGTLYWMRGGTARSATLE